VISDPAGAGKDSEDAWYSDQLFRSPDSIATQGTLP